MMYRTSNIQDLDRPALLKYVKDLQTENSLLKARINFWAALENFIKTRALILVRALVVIGLWLSINFLIYLLFSWFCSFETVKTADDQLVEKAFTWNHPLLLIFLIAINCIVLLSMAYVWLED